MISEKEIYTGVTGGNPEAELLLLCSRVSIGLKKMERMEALLQEEIDWERLLRMAKEHGMTPLLYRHLSSNFPELVPAEMLARLREQFNQNSLRNLLLAGELLQLLDLFERHGIPVVPYKGPVLATLAYKNLSLRKSGDLDLQLPRQHVREARDLLVSRGYSPRSRLDEAQEAAFLYFEREYGLTHDELLIDVELQWRVMPLQFPFPLEVDSLRGGLQRVSLGSGSVKTFAPEELLLILCVHGTKDFWECLYLVCDVAEIIDVHRGMDWERLIEEATATGSERMLYLGLFLARDLLGAELPEKVWRRVCSDPGVEELAGEVYTWLFRESGDSRGMLAGSEFHHLHFRVRKRPRDKFRYWLRTVVTPNYADWLHRPLPEHLFFLYYLVRPMRLAGKYGRRLLERVTG